METFLRVRDVAKKFRLTEATIRSYVLNGKIPCYKIGSALRFKECELDEWVKNDCPRGAKKIMKLEEYLEATKGNAAAADGGGE